jgi:tRNA-dihydrouridine synthase B
MIKIGKHQLTSNILLAPMSGVSDLPFRKQVKKFGAGLVVSEMIASRAMILQTRQSMQKAQFDKGDRAPSVVQLAGCDPKVMAEAAKMNEDLGADIIDINFGCPVKKVTGGNAGSALMKYPKLAMEILKEVVAAVNIPVTLKMRMGWDEQSLNAPQLATIAEDIGIQLLTIHGRTRCQMYKGHANWKFIKNIKDVVKIPVIANGDIKSLADAQQALKESNADGIMVGRGAYGKPWLINQIDSFLNHDKILPDPSLVEKKAIILDHFADMIDYYGSETGVRLARKHMGWYSSGIDKSAEFRMKINKTTNVDEVSDLVHDFF